MPTISNACGGLGRITICANALRNDSGDTTTSWKRNGLTHTKDTRYRRVTK